MMYKNITFEIWVKFKKKPENVAWVLSQAPDYSYSRAIAVNDHRLGLVGITSGHENYNKFK